MSSNDMAQRIKELRKANHLTLEQVANVVGVGKSTVRKWETGMIANMRRDKIAVLAKALNTTPAYLMGWDTKENDLSSKAICKVPAEPSPDVAKRMETILQELEQEEALMFDGEPMDEESLELIRASLKNAYKIAMASKKISKKSDDV